MVPKARILAVVTEGGVRAGRRAAREVEEGAITTAAEQQIVGTGWLPSILRTA